MCWWHIISCLVLRLQSRHQFFSSTKKCEYRVYTKIQQQLCCDGNKKNGIHQKSIKFHDTQNNNMPLSHGYKCYCLYWHENLFTSCENVVKLTNWNMMDIQRHFYLWAGSKLQIHIFLKSKKNINDEELKLWFSAEIFLVHCLWKICWGLYEKFNVV
jgi:hypothetical protein